jgi:hypothetical protein
MNDIVARLYSYLMTAMHFIFIALMVYAAFNYQKHGVASSEFWVYYVGFIIAYLLSVGTLITFIRMNENLEAIRKSLERAPLPSGGFEPRID